MFLFTHLFIQPIFLNIYYKPEHCVGDLGSSTDNVVTPVLSQDLCVGERERGLQGDNKYKEYTLY